MLMVFCLLAITLTLLWIKAKPFYWKKKNIPYLIPLPLFGNVFPILIYGITKYFGILIKKFPGHKYYGMHFLTRPVLFIKDPQTLQDILVKDFEHFTSHGFYSNQDRDAGGGNLFLLHGQQWKEMRSKLNLYFTPAKIKAMLGCADNTMPKLTAILDKNIADGKPSDMHILLQNTTTDIITQAIFGVESDSFTDEHSLFSEIAREMFDPKFTWKLYLSVISPKLYNLLKCTIFGRHFNRLITDIVKKTIDYRRKNNIHKQDFLQGMMELLDTEKKDEERKYFPDNTRVPNYDLDTVIAQAIILHVGGVETSSLTMSFLLYELAINPDIQNRCRAEVISVVGNDEPLAVKDLTELPYLSATVKETMRKHSAFVMTTRECTKTYQFPDSDLIIERGTFVFTSTMSVQMEEENFPEPEAFRPERFLDDEKDSIKPGTYFPFGIGPRICIGMNFGFSEMKLVIGRLLQLYEFSICSKTQVPLVYNKFRFLTTPEKGVWLDLKPLKGN